MASVQKYHRRSPSGQVIDPPEGAGAGGCLTYRVGYTGEPGLGIYDNYDECHAAAQIPASDGVPTCVNISWDPTGDPPEFSPDTDYDGLDRITHNWVPDRVALTTGVLGVTLPGTSGFRAFAGANFPRCWTTPASQQGELIFLGSGDGPNEAVYYYDGPSTTTGSSLLVGKKPTFNGAARWQGSGSRHLVRLDWYGPPATPIENSAVVQLSGGFLFTQQTIRATRGLLMYLGEAYRQATASQVVSDGAAAYALGVAYMNGPDNLTAGRFDPAAVWAGTWSAINVL